MGNKKFSIKIFNAYRLLKQVILIDGIRSLHTDKENYPPISFYLKWANSEGIDWIK